MDSGFLYGFFAKCAEFGLGCKEALLLLEKTSVAPPPQQMQPMQSPVDSILQANDPGSTAISNAVNPPALGGMPGVPGAAPGMATAGGAPGANPAGAAPGGMSMSTSGVQMPAMK